MPISRTINLSDLENGYKWKIYTLEKPTKESVLELLKSTSKVVGIDENFNVPVVVNPLGLECILTFKNGKRELTHYNHIYKGNKVVFYTENGFQTLAKIKGIESIIFFDDIIYHEQNRQYWTDRGVKSTEVYKTKQALLNEILEGIQ